MRKFFSGIALSFMFLLSGIIMVACSCSEPKTFSVSYELDGGQFLPNAEVVYEYEEGNTVTLTNDLIKVDYNFVGWFTDSELTNKVTQVSNQNATVYASWQRRQYSVSYDANGGTLADVQNGTYTSSQQIACPTLENAVKEQSKLVGWKQTISLDLAQDFYAGKIDDQGNITKNGQNENYAFSNKIKLNANVEYSLPVSGISLYVYNQDGFVEKVSVTDSLTITRDSDVFVMFVIDKNNSEQTSALGNSFNVTSIATAITTGSMNNVTYKAVWEQYTVKNGSNYYLTLEDAIENATAGDTITLLASEYEVSEAITIDKDLTLTSLVNACITRKTNFNDNIFKVDDDTTLTIKAESDKTLTIDGKSAELNYSLIYLDEGAHLNLFNGSVLSNNTNISSEDETLSQATKGGAVNSNKGSITIDGGKIEKCNSTEKGGAVYISRATLTFKSGLISTCTSKNGSAVYLNRASMVFDGGEISNCYASGAGTINLYKKANESDVCTLEMNNNATIKLNTATKGGAGVLNDGATVTLNSGLITENISISDNGAGIRNKVGTVNIYNGMVISKNDSSNKKGGGIYNYATLNIYGGSILENIAESGGGIGNDAASTTNISGGLIKLNTSLSGGGGILNDKGTMLISGGTIEQNVAKSDDGAGIRNKLGTLTIDNAIITNNDAKDNVGGGLFNTGTMIINNAQITSNKARNGGGIGNKGHLTINNVFVSLNVATTNGGGLHTIETSSATDVTTTINGGEFSGNTATNGGGIHGSNYTITACVVKNNIANSGAGLSLEQSNINGTETSGVKSVQVIGNQTTSKKGGGLYIGTSSTMVVENVLVQNNKGDEGGGVHVSTGEILFKNCVINKNQAVKGAGINSDYNTNITIENCQISENVATIYGGAIKTKQATLAIKNTTITANQAKWGAAIDARDIALTILDCSITSNTATNETTKVDNYIIAKSANSVAISGNSTIDSMLINVTLGDEIDNVVTINGTQSSITKLEFVYDAIITEEEVYELTLGELTKDLTIVTFENADLFSTLKANITSSKGTLTFDETNKAIKVTIA